MTFSDLKERARLYTVDRCRAIEAVPLGDGTDGCVWQTDRKTAIKVFERLHNFETELECYQLFQEKCIIEIHSYAIPRLIDYQWIAIEMDIVQQPYILDFGKAYFKRQRPQFSAETIQESLAEQKET